LEDLVLLGEVSNAKGSLRGKLIIGQIALFAINKNCLSMSIVGFVEKGVGTGRIEEGTRPGCSAIHTMRVIDGAQQILFNTLGT